MKKKSIDWRVHFKQLLEPRLIQALKADARGVMPLGAEARRTIKKMLALVMTPAEVRALTAKRRR
jgi:hypothetical protein